MTQKLPYVLVAVDVCIFALHEKELYVCLTPCDNPYFKNSKALPGSLVRNTETTGDAAERIITERAGLTLSLMHLEQLETFSSVDRDPRSRAVAVGYLGLYRGKLTDSFVRVKDATSLAYDHADILKVAYARLSSKLSYTTIAQTLIPREFTLSQLKSVYDVVWNEEVDKRNFVKKFESLDVLVDSGKKYQEGRMRPAALYTFAKKGVHMLPLFKK